MALQKEVTTISVVKRVGYIITFGLKCWEETANPEVDTPVVDRSYTCYVKSQVTGKPVSQLLTEACLLTQSRMQEDIDLYVSGQVLLDNPMLETRRAAMEAGLTG